MKISRLMSTQHPDNVNTPFFARDPVIGGDDEIQEAFYVYSHLKIDEQLWDAEGKEVDSFVVEKLFSRYSSYFRENILGRDKFLTLRLPNPDVEPTQGKILLESLHSIPRNFDLARAFYQEDIPPVFEVVLPMCRSEKNITRVHQYYLKHIIDHQHLPVLDKDVTIGSWLGRFQPSDIRVTPLFETKEAILNSAVSVERYVRSEKIRDLQRVWFARSDPALNYSSTAAVLLVKIALYRMHELEKKLGMEILPIVGCGSAPFRGNFKPTNVLDMARGYPSVQTFTVQSAFKYDYPLRQVLEAIEQINCTKRGSPLFIDADLAERYIEKMEKDYVKSIMQLAPVVNLMSTYVPQRRRRKLHTGLFGYSRSSKGVALPRAIKFCSALYSLGLPPEVLGLSALKPDEIHVIRGFYHGIDNDMADALQFVNRRNLDYFPWSVRRKINRVLEMFDFRVNAEHEEITTEILAALKKQDIHRVQEGILKAAHIRRFLG
ncbi:MAG: phosphoenolpyruvate carboxylase [Candidatus Wallbacteria bacterium]|nr:phosphoenolpyruvate carboxylase [Candidatus Wallbacteria bacterium]